MSTSHHARHRLADIDFHIPTQPAAHIPSTPLMAWRSVKQKLFSWGGLAIAGVVLGSATATAEEVASRADDKIIEEIFVTATHRATNLMDTAQSISAITDSLVENLGAQSAADIFQMVPGLNMSGATDGANRFAIRGITSQVGVEAFRPTAAMTGIYVDGVGITSALGPALQIDGNLFDIDRVEVLKGPQGTLFGEGSQAGTIRYLYKQPDPTKFDAAVNASMANMSESQDTSYRVDGMVNIPLSDQVALRLSAYDSETAGYIDNLRPFEKDYNPRSTRGGRAAIKYEGERVQIVGTIHHSIQETEGGSATVRAYETDASRSPGNPPFSEDKTTIYSLAVDVDFDWATLTSITSITDRERHAFEEGSSAFTGILEFIFVPIFSLGQPPGTFLNDGMNIVAINSNNRFFVDRFAQELRLVSAADQRMRWTAGVFYKDSEDKIANTLAAEYGPLPQHQLFGLILDTLLVDPANAHTDTTEEVAVFGEVSYDLTDTLELTVGARLSKLKQEFNTLDQGTDDTTLSPKVVLSWRPKDDLLTYFSYATGFRPGNANHDAATRQRQFLIQRDLAIANGLPDDAVLAQAEADFAGSTIAFDGDTVNNYELGIKATLLNGRAQVAASAYYMDWEDAIIQDRQSAVSGSALQVFHINAGGAHTQGLEVEVVAFLTDRFSIRLAGDVNEAEFDDPPSQFTIGQEGNELSYAPKHSASVALDYDWPVSDRLLLSFHFDHAWVAKQWVNITNTDSLPSYEKSNARITLSDADAGWRLALYSRNLGNEEILRDKTSPLQGITPDLFWYPPRTVGLEFGYKL